MDELPMPRTQKVSAPKNSRTELDFFQGWCAVALVALILVIAAGTLLVLHVMYGVPVGDLTRDALAVAKSPPWYGLLSQIGIFFWAGAATMGLFLWATARGMGAEQRQASFGLFSALLTILLGLDDALMMHEKVFPEIFGIPENFVLVSYVVLLLAFLFFFRGVIIRTDMKLLVFSLFLFGASMLVDFFLVSAEFLDLIYFIEDGAKFGGIVAWCGFFFVHTRSLVLRHSST
ncbi:MAG: hypothetical protein GTN98_14620 [Woeseiaceae bacterium]|nr:hypothetical protein [Woeseiaceae bacterium]